jgi:hypothetical protein
MPQLLSLPVTRSNIAFHCKVMTCCSTRFPIILMGLAVECGEREGVEQEAA